MILQVTERSCHVTSSKWNSEFILGKWNYKTLCEVSLILKFFIGTIRTDAAFIMIFRMCILKIFNDKANNCRIQIH